MPAIPDAAPGVLAASAGDRFAGDRFASWPRGLARLALVGLIMLVIAAAVVPIHSRIRRATALHPAAFQVAPHAASVRHGAPGPPNPRGKDHDLALYDRVVEHVRRGDPYYPAVVGEQRGHYPVTPGFAVRLPTLAFIEAAVGVVGEWIAAIALFAAVLLAWWRRLGEEPGGRAHRLVAMVLLGWLAARGLYGYFFVLHELWAGMLLALAFGLHRRGRWHGAFAAAALALAIRELALPFVLLMAATAAWRRDWRQVAAWVLLVAVFAAGMALHFHLVAEQTRPTDIPSGSWLALRGLSGWLSNAVLASNLRIIDHSLAGVLVILAMLGWAGWRSDAGAFGFWLYGGYGVAFMIAGRWENFYWGEIIGPAQLVGLAFAPRALASLVEAGFPGSLARVRPLLHKLPRWRPRAFS